VAVSVPQLIGLDPDAAAAAANGRGLLLSVIGEVASEAIPAGLVAEQEPRAEATATQGETVAVRLSTGSDRVDLGALNLVGRDADEAEALLRERGLRVTRTEEGSAEVPEGAVVGVAPPEAASAGETVTLRVSVGDRVRIPPEIQGQPLDQVARQLGELGLRIDESIPVDRATIEGFGLDLVAAAIADGDVVGVQGAEGVDFGVWLPPGTEVDLVYYDSMLDGE
jgi:serine/threonine-protein kinase